MTTEDNMNQILLYKTSPTANGSATRFFFVREYRNRHDNVALAHRDSLLYNQSKFKNAIALYPEFTQIDSMQSELSREDIIAHYEALGYVCLNVQRNRK